MPRIGDFVSNGEDGPTLTSGARHTLQNYEGEIPRRAILTMALHIQAQYGSLRCHRLHVVMAIQRLNGGET